MGRTWVWFRNGILLLVLATFVFFFGPGMARDTVGGPVAQVAGQPISRDVFEFFRERQEARFKELSAQEIDNEQLSAFIDQQTRTLVVHRYVMTQEARELGFEVPDAVLASEIRTSPNFQIDGKYERGIVEQNAARSGLGLREYMDQYKIDLATRAFLRTTSSPIRVSDAAARAEIARAKTKVSLRYATVSRAALRAKAAVTPEVAKALLASNAERVRATYQMRISEFKTEEQVHARHILFTGDDAEARALQVRGRLDAGEDFAALAKELSADAATREEGGDLGTFPRGRMLPAFDEVAFALEAGVVSGPVKTDRGVHLIRLDSREPARETPFEEVSEKLATELALDDAAGEAARSSANDLLARVKGGESFEAAAAALHLPVSVTPPYALGDLNVPGLGAVAEVKEVGFALSADAPTADRVFADSSSENFYVVALANRDEPSAEAIEGELATAREQIQERLRSETNELWYRTRLKALRDAGEITEFEIAKR